MNPMDFRAELVKVMPGYKWTVHKSRFPCFLVATGTQSAGFNRLSTLEVSRRDMIDKSEYIAKSAGNGRRAVWLHTNKDATLARALRGLQNHYEVMESVYRAHAWALQICRGAARSTESTSPTGQEEKQ